MSLRNKILVTGHPGTGGLELIHSVLRASNSEIPNETKSQEDGRMSGIQIPWTINTKYYKANVEFLFDEINTESDSERKTIEAYSLKENEVGNVVDAFVYMFDKNKPETFKGALCWLSFLDNFEPSIRLCIGSTSKGSTTEKERSLYEDWCLEHRFEYIDMDDAEDDASDASASDQALQALQANMWDGLDRKDSKTVPKQGIHGNEDEQDLDKLLEGIQRSTINADNLEISDSEDYDSLDLPTKSEISEMQRELFGTPGEDDDLDKTLEKLQAMRDQGKDLPDEERRKLAAQVAMSFAAQLGL